MARLPYLEAADLPEQHQDLLKRPIFLHRLLANSPQAARKFGQLGQWIRYECSIDPRQREIAILTVGYLARSPYEYSHHTKIGMDFGVTEADINALAAYLDGGTDGSHFSAQDLAIIDAAHELTDKPELSDANYARLSDFLSSENLVDLTVTIAFYACVVRVLGAFQMDVEPDYQPYLERFPLPSE